jgi:hypothetical protein
MVKIYEKPMIHGEKTGGGMELTVTCLLLLYTEELEIGMIEGEGMIIA